MPPVVRTRRTTAISLPSGGAPLPAPGRRVPLSPFDARWLALPPVCHVLLFPAPSPPVPFSDVARALRSSLEAVLPAFHPFSGELVYSPESRTVAIVCGRDARVAFVEAETDHEFARLVEEGAQHDAAVFRQFAPDIRREELPAPVMAAQVTEFVGGGGGMAVGLAVHHAAADGSGFWRFLELWAAAAKAAAAGAEEGRVVGDPPVPPLHDRSLVRFDGDEELVGVILGRVTPDLPRVSFLPKRQDPSPERRSVLIRRTFTFAASAVRRLKQRVAATGLRRTAPSTFAALAAHAWVSMARASGFEDDGAPVFAVFLADCRAHMSPPVPDAYVGNCVATCVVPLTGAELAGPDGPSLAFTAIGDAVAEVKRDPLADRRRCITRFRAIPPGRAVILVGSPRFPAFAVDFGFGRPARSEHASVNHDGEMVLHAGREAGLVQVSVAVAGDKMAAFREMFAVDP